MKTKEELLKELEKLGRHPTGRKIRSDSGKSHKTYTTSEKPRKDMGQKRGEYTKTAAYYKRIFVQYIQSHTNEAGEDDLTRDANLIFSPNVTHRYKLVTTPDGKSYRSSVKRRNHPEKLRWMWWFQEWQEATTLEVKLQWEERICNNYFITSVDLPMWTYNEWAWSYVTQIGGHLNRNVANPITLSYDEFVFGYYKRPMYDNNGEILWNL